MAVRPRQEVPKELEFLLPDRVAKPIVIGDQAYNLYPLTEGEFERISLEVTKLFNAVFVEGKVSPVEYLMQEEVLIGFLAEALKPLSKDDIKANLTAKQLMYAAAVIWEMNFDTEGDFDKKTNENFKKVLSWMGLGAAVARTEAPERT